MKATTTQPCFGHTLFRPCRACTPTSALTLWLCCNRHKPANMHLIITTRADPPLTLVRLRARDKLTELRANDLRFTGQESAAFLTQAMGLNLSASEIEALKRRTEG
jgi:ATP/maltotriose-dependent transcriptional regulator MalT